MSQRSALEDAASIDDDPVVLYFHHVGRRFDHYTSIGTDEFRRALDVLAEFGPLADPRGRRSGSGYLITFDDGYAESVDTALPVLEERGARAVLFVNTATVGGSVEASAAHRPLPATTWDALAAAAERGHAIGSHGHNHLPWPELSDADVHHEVVASRDAIRDALQRDPVAYAYPYGLRPIRVPTTLEDYACYGTAREPAAHHRCRPQAVRRVYLPARDPAAWRPLLRGWKSRRRTRCDGGGCDARPMVGTRGDAAAVERL